MTEDGESCVVAVAVAVAGSTPPFLHALIAGSNPPFLHALIARLIDQALDASFACQTLLAQSFRRSFYALAQSNRQHIGALVACLWIDLRLR